MKRVFSIAAAFVVALTFAGCGKSGADVDLESSWDKEVKEYTFLKSFPKYDYEFQGSYQKVTGGETYVLMDRKGSEAKWNEYKSKLSKAGFSERVMTETASSFTKKDEKGEYTASPSMSGSSLIVSYAFRKTE